jgi:glycosyltransferase involved in cell wall biosynthesis
LITVGVTTYNRQELLRECVRSILDQEYDNVEILIGNDYVAGPVTIASLGFGADPRIRIINHPQNIGAYQNNYFLLREAGGDWFTWLADDDLMHPAFLRLAHEALTTSDALSFFCSYAAAPDPAGTFPGEPGKHGELKIYEGAEFVTEYAARRVRAVGSYGVFRRELLSHIDSVPRFGSGLAVYVDTFIPLVAAAHGRVAHRNADLVFLRTHPGSQSASSSTLRDYASAQRDFMTELGRRDEFWVDRLTAEGWRTSFLWWFAQDVWHVVCKRSPHFIPRMIDFARYYAGTLAPLVPARSRSVFTARVWATILTDGIRQMCHGALRSPSPATAR